MIDKSSILIYRLTVNLFLTASFLLFLHSCRSTAPVATSERHFTGDHIHKMLTNNNLDFETYSVGRLMVKIIDNDEELNVRGNVRIQKDSAILISINAFAGIEAARFLFTVDSVKMIDRINNKYFAGNYQESQKLIPFGVNYDIIQNIFFASPLNFNNGVDVLEGSKEQFMVDNQLITLRFAADHLLAGNRNLTGDILQFVIDQNFLTRSVDFHSREKNIFASLKYNSFSKLEGFMLPDDISLNFISHNLPFHANLQLGRIEVNKPVNFSFSIPARYSPINQ
jgi:hypothetical protein